MDWETHVVAMHHQLVAAEDDPQGDDRAGPSPRLLARHSSFHLSLVAACSNGYVLDVCDQLLDVTSLYCLWSAEAPRHVTATVREHKVLLDAALARDASAAAAALSQHLERTRTLPLDPRWETGGSTP
jgi:DNA-binding GntR family transcriptional regulator